MKHPEKPVMFFNNHLRAFTRTRANTHTHTHTHTHTRTDTRTRECAHAHTQTHVDTLCQFLVMQQPTLQAGDRMCALVCYALHAIPLPVHSHLLRAAKKSNAIGLFCGKFWNIQTGEGINFASESKAGFLSYLRPALTPPAPPLTKLHLLASL